MIAEAVDTLTTLGWALAIWIVLVSLAVTAALYTVAVTIGAATYLTVRVLRGAWRWATGTHTGSDDPEAVPPLPKPADGRTRPHVPAWAHTDKDAA